MWGFNRWNGCGASAGVAAVTGAGVADAAVTGGKNSH